MATATNFSGRSAPWKRLCQKSTAKPAIGSLAIKTTCSFGQNRLRTRQNGIHGERKAESKLYELNPVMASYNNTNQLNSSHELSPSEIVKQFYACINKKDIKRLRKYISADCYLEECSFLSPFHGAEEVLDFFNVLSSSMGANVEFKVKHVCQDGLMASANWHLEWKKRQIPFTRGCSFFECSKLGEKIIIKRAQIVIESPIKPGGLVLVLLKIVTKIFDDFPATTEWFLNGPHVLLQWLLKIYNLLWGMFIKPVLTSYLHIWNLSTRLSSFGFHIFFYIIKFFIK